MINKKSDKFDAAFIVAAKLAGSVSLFLFGLFLLFGARPVIDMQMPGVTALRWNTALSLLFFIQHSGMVRRSLSARLSGVIPAGYHRALYTIVSGLVLTAVVVLWQPSHELLLELKGALRWGARGIFFLGLAGFAWGTGTLKSFDAFGETYINAHRNGQKSETQLFTIGGPYLWVRHPLYFFTLVLIWSCPDVTEDRLLFNVLWTAWIYIGALLEERDLAAAFGDQYRRYQRTVPMLIPWKGPIGRSL